MTFYDPELWENKAQPHTELVLGLRVNPHSKKLTLNFENLLPDWLKILVKFNILAKSRQNLTAQYLAHKISHLNRFSRFLTQKSVYTAEQINPQIFQEFDDYLHTLNLAKRTISCHYITLGDFFDVCRLSGWLDVGTYWFQGKRLPMRGPKNDEIEYIPEEVWNQLEQHLHCLPEPIQRMVIIIKTTGIRIGELLNLPLDCLRKRGTQWRLRFTEVLGNEYEELMKAKKYVDISGQVVLEHQPQNAITELMRRKMYQVTTQYGECHRPVIKAPCQTVNACWRCEHWRTSTEDVTVHGGVKKMSHMKSHGISTKTSLELIFFG